MNALRCLRCNRPLVRFAASIQTRDGLLGWGPDCAKTVTVTPARPVRGPRAELRQRPLPRDPRQLDWVEEAAA
jgi:hypothetical protein